MTDPRVYDRLMSEGLIPLKEACKLVPSPRTGKRRSTSTLVRWILKGKRGHRLEAVRFPDGSWSTTRQALARYLAAITQEAGT